MPGSTSSTKEKAHVTTTTTTTTTKPRALLLTGIVGHGWGLRRVVEQAVAEVFKDKDKNNNNNNNNQDIKVQIRYDKTIHGTVRNGAAVVIFPTARHATAALHAWQPPTDNRGCSSNNDRTTTTTTTTTLHYQGCILTASYAAGRLRDHLFAALPQRHELQLDAVAAYSCTDLQTASRMTTALSAIVMMGCGVAVVDAMACIGGNTLAFARSDDIKSVVAIELDEKRAQMLQHNLQTALLVDKDDNKKVTVLAGQCCFEYLATTTIQPSRNDPTVIFFDPPWGGKDYRKQQTPQQHLEDETTDETNSVPTHIIEEEDTTKETPQIVDNFSFTLSPDTAEALGLSVDENNHHGQPWSFSLCTIIGQVLTQRRADAVAVKVGTDAVGNALVQSLVQQAIAPFVKSNGRYRECDFPFLFSFGASTQMIVIVRNTAAAGATGAGQPSFTNTTLDEMVARIHQWHITQGYREHKPRFYDYDKQRWIVLKKWKPTGGIVKKRID